MPHEDSDHGSGDNPRTYPILPRYKSFGIRRCVHGDELIFTTCSRGRRA